MYAIRSYYGNFLDNFAGTVFLRAFDSCCLGLNMLTFRKTGTGQELPITSLLINHGPAALFTLFARFNRLFFFNRYDGTVLILFEILRECAGGVIFTVITSYSIHYTKLYEQTTTA